MSWGLQKQKIGACMSAFTCAALSFLSLAVAGTVAGCEGPPSEVFGAGDGFESPDGRGQEGLSMRGFSWVVDGKLAGMPILGRAQALALDIAFLDQQSVDLLVSLTIEAIPKADLAARGIDALHLPVRDFSAPTQEQMLVFVREIAARHAVGEKVGVHCTAGLGRSGTMLAAYFVSTGMNAEQAIAHIRELRPGSIETTSQEDAIAEFAATLRSSDGSDAFP
ncbi:MAG: dual specificity protein phosphatase family protein [Kofleriaceae bacterium]|nr:dual specificity protein phosphatase family protein [Kofleriaceae bacterium]